MEGDKDALVAARSPNLGIVTAYNDMLSAHQPFKGITPTASRRPRAAPGPRRRSQAAFRPCAMA
jgi:phosphogluconate dehydratase